MGGIYNFVQGVSLERIDDLFAKPWMERVNVKLYLRLVYNICIYVTGFRKIGLNAASKVF